MKRFLLPLILLTIVIIAGVLYSLNASKKPKQKDTPVPSVSKTTMKQITITSPAFEDRGKIPSKYTCDGEDINPPLDFENVPEDTQSLVLIVEDPDAPGKTWVHWVVFNISPTTTHIAEDSVPGRGIEAVTDFGHAGYGGACPPSGTHRYYFKLFALDTELDVTEDVNKAEIEHAMEGHIMEKAELVGLYSRE
jgi:hypothetical protein